MIDLSEFPWNYSLVTLLFHCLHALRKVLLMALRSRPPLPYLPCPMHRRCMNFSPGRRRIFASVKHPRRNSGISTNPLPSDHQTPVASSKEDTIPDKNGNGIRFMGNHHFPNEKTTSAPAGAVAGLKSAATCEGGGASRKHMRRMPIRIAIPQSRPEFIFDEMGPIEAEEKEEALAEGKGFYLASKRGKRKVIEDGYRVITGIHGDSKQVSEISKTIFSKRRYVRE